MTLLRLIRFPNLVIVALTQLLLFYQVLAPAFQSENIGPLLDDAHLSLLVLCTILLASTGYIINDLHDLAVDRINRPQQVIIDRMISRQTAYWLYFCGNLTGFFIALYLALYVQNLPLLAIFPTAAAGLYLYSVALKQKPLTKNVVVSFFCAGVGGIIWFAERDAFAELMKVNPDLGNKVAYIFAYYLTFAFISTLFRELVKDIEDQQGDRAASYRTAPIQWGMSTVRMFAFGMGLTLLALLLLGATYLHVYFPGHGIYLVVLILLPPILLALFWLWKAENKSDYSRLSSLAKFIMLGGVILLLLINI